MSTQAAAEVEAEPTRSNAYDLFILVLTVLSLVIMLGLVLPWLNDATKKLLNIYDNLICLVFLYDFAWNFSNAHPRRDYFVGRRGWLDLLGLDPQLRLLPLHGAVPARATEPADADHSADARQEQARDRRGHP